MKLEFLNALLLLFDVWLLNPNQIYVNLNAD